jgi:uncharacterized glyoxalase superfamily protein PhnB
MLLAKGEAMDSASIRPGFQSVVPYLAIQRGDQLVKFLADAFDAQHTYRSTTGAHFDAKIGNSMLMIGDVGPRAPQPAHNSCMSATLARCITVHSRRVRHQ